MPVVRDIFSHLFTEAEHILTVHAHDGDHHLEEELAEAGDDYSHEHNSRSVKIEDQMPVHVLPRLTLPCGGWMIRGNNLALVNSGKLPLMFLSKHGPPPKFLF